MSDILSTRSLGEAAIHRPQAGTAASPVATVLVADAAFKLPNLSVGALITGVVTEKAARGTVVIQTDKGNLTIQANIPLPVGSTVVLQLQSVGTQSRVVILSVNGQPIGSPESPPPGANPTAVRTSTLAPSVSQTEFHRPSAAPAGALDRSSLQPGINPARPESGLGADPGGVKVPPLARNPTGQSRSPLANGLVLPAHVLEGASGVSSGGNGSGLKPGQTLTVRVLGMGPPGLSNLEPGVPPQTTQQDWLRGTIALNTIGRGAGGAAPHAATGVTGSPGLILTTPQGKLVLPAAAPGPEGMAVLLEVIGHPNRGTERNTAVLDSQQTFIKMAREWSSLKEAVEILQPTVGLEAAGSPVLSTLPAPGPALASTILFFLSALKGGDFRGWLSSAAVTQLGETQEGRLLSRLSDDFSQLGRLALVSQPSGWQVMLIPIVWGNLVDQIRLYHRHQRGNGDQDGEASGRFIVEAELKRFGVVQLDGLIKQQKFDLALRSDVQFTPDMQNHIRGIFQSALEIGGMNGSVRFESPTRNSVDPFHLDAADTSHGNDVIV